MPSNYSREYKSAQYKSHGRTGLNTSIEKAVDFWRRSQRIEEGHPAQVYLESRGLWPLLPGEELRCGKRFDFHVGEEGLDSFYIVALLADHEGNERAIQYLRLTNEGEARIGEDGHKDRVTLGRAKGAAVWPVLMGQPKMGVAEGLETAMAVRRLYEIPCFATLGAWALASWRPPSYWLKELIVFADRDPPGIRAAQHLAARIRGMADFGEEMPSVSIVQPAEEGVDFADMWEARS